MSDDYFNTSNPNNYWAQQANIRAEEANERTKRAHKNVADIQHDINNQRQSTQSNIDLIMQLRQKVGVVTEKAQNLESENVKLESEKEFFENLLSLPMKEIAEKNDKFKETYEAQQLVLSKWILSQKAYAETAVQIGLESGKTTEEIHEIYKGNVVAVLANATKHGNDSVTNPILKENATKIARK